MHTQKLRHELIIHALPSKLWKVLTAPEYTRQFLIEPELLSDWKKDSPIILQQNRQKGQVEEAVPGLLLRFSLHEEALGAEGPVVIQYELVPEENGVRLILSQELAFHTSGLSHMRAEYGKMMLQKIKWLAEYS